MTPDWRPHDIGGHAMISDGQTAALIYEDATIDWLCMPRFDSQACLASLLGTAENGGWWIGATDAPLRTSRSYRDDTMILETVIETEGGEVAIIDFMPVQRGEAPDIVRIIEGRRGAVELETRLALRFDHGRTHPMVRQHDDGEMLAIAGPNAVILRFCCCIGHQDRAFTGKFTVREGERKALCLTWFESESEVPRAIDPEKALEEAERFWRDWADKTEYEGIADKAVRRSLLTLKALVHEHTGGMVAAATASLPERPGGQRNWDYRFCWLRDATFTLLGFLHTGHKDEAREWIEWLRRAVAGEPIDVQPFYAIDGNRHSLEWEADWLQGFGDSRPVRFGNGAVGQVQLDIYGEVIDAICVARCHGLAEDSDDLIAALAEKLETLWREPDAGIWESRGDPKHHVYSKVMCWVAFDRAAKMLGDAMPERARRWRDLAEEVREQVLTHGFNENRGAFTRAFDDDALDGAVLRLPIVGFIDATDERMRKTVDAIERELMSGDMVYRYSNDTTDDGVGGAEGAFVAVGLWLADVYAQQGRSEDARRLFDAALNSANDLGLLSEECWMEDGRQIGNIPQALSHVALVNTALSISADGRPPRLA
ncbi:glycoside hydrolase family 15 protein [Stakelama pacifica]|uniref:GH15 family glucan-1,4-alpha-glucosidase n=1 Tax=Stakelama pacifica TaxID=517720 RepID=A0A4R6FMX6_9SPHN|nr:glycoside hydrolase family 15 protein [Stakelama pacifica]TDN82946.1 GH15 family glucan-1,4-alpha-glucosidase [Stakelama pacifica]GGO95123.1 glucoamylase [Stakelama pacifica]